MEGPHDELDPERRGTGTLVSVVFTSVTRGVVELDCVAESGPGAGWPFTMWLGLPAHATWAAAAERMLARWADDGTVVLVEVRVTRRPAQIRMSDGSTSVLLDVTAAGSVFR